MEEIQFSDSVSGSIRSGILVVTINNPPVNAMSANARSGIVSALAYAAGERAVQGIVLTGAGTIFIGGADIKEFGKPPVDPILLDVVRGINAMDKPVVAAVNGAAIGGGVEVAIACHARVAAENASFSLPEVKLGIVPGAGGTQSLPRLIGTAASIELIGSGRSVKAAEAKSLELADDVATDAVAKAISEALQLQGTTLRRLANMSVPPGDPAEVDAVTKRVLSKARGQAAPAEAVRLIKAAANLSLEEGHAQERAVFLKLLGSREAAALRYLFFGERSAGKSDKVAGIDPRQIETVGIVGLGLMGMGIAATTLASGYRVIGIEQTEERAGHARRRIDETLEKAVQSGRLSNAGRGSALSKLTVTSEMHLLSDADLIIEAVFDDFAVKTDLFRSLDSIVRSDAILATNTSYLNPDEIAAETMFPQRIVGLHFFSPANIMRLVEVVDCSATAPIVLASVLAFVKKLGKLPVISGVIEGFIGNRIYSAYRREAEFMLEDGAFPEEIDAALEAWGFPMGIFAVNDMTGLEIAWARRKRQAASRDPEARYVEVADRLCEAGRFGRKAGRGWYSYASGQRAVDPEVTALIVSARAAKGIVPRALLPGEIVDRVLKAMAAEGNELLGSGIAARVADIDLVMVNGYGFPSHKGGPMFQGGLG